MSTLTRPGTDEAAPYYFKYIDRVPGDDVVGVLTDQLEQAPKFWGAITEDKSRHRYEPGKWSIREALAHVSDTERVFQFRTFWFARGFEAPLPSFDQDTAAGSALAHERPLASLLDEFLAVRRSTLALVRSLPEEAWSRRGTASGNPFTARGMVFVTAGHAAHHVAVVRERYL
ncbi:MAG TPA: DinB family protein [Vicinamibacteria bacterium]|nr:DinB family protein [Vicinamibacteria bacterium]